MSQSGSSNSSVSNQERPWVDLHFTFPSSSGKDTSPLLVEKGDAAFQKMLFNTTLRMVRWNLWTPMHILALRSIVEKRDVVALTNFNTLLADIYNSPLADLDRQTY